MQDLVDLCNVGLHAVNQWRNRLHSIRHTSEPPDIWMLCHARRGVCVGQGIVRIKEGSIEHIGVKFQKSHVLALFLARCLAKGRRWILLQDTQRVEIAYNGTRQVQFVSPKLMQKGKYVRRSDIVAHQNNFALQAQQKGLGGGPCVSEGRCFADL